MSVVLMVWMIGISIIDLFLYSTVDCFFIIDNFLFKEVDFFLSVVLDSYWIFLIKVMHLSPSTHTFTSHSISAAGGWSLSQH